MTKIEWKDSAGTVQKKQEYTYGADRRVERVINPVVAGSSAYQKWLYDDDGVPA